MIKSNAPLNQAISLDVFSKYLVRTHTSAHSLTDDAIDWIGSTQREHYKRRLPTSYVVVDLYGYQGQISKS